MKRVLFVGLAILGTLIALLLFAPNLIPAATYKPRIERAASAAIGREVRLGGDLAIRIFPTTAFTADDLTIANAEGFEGDYLAQVARAAIGVKLFPLLAGDIAVDRFVLTEPQINLARSADGAVNWNLASGEASSASETQDEGGPRSLSLGDVRIVNGRATYADAAGGQSYEMREINLTVGLESLDAPLEVDGDLLFQGEPTTIDLVLTDLSRFLAGDEANAKLALDIGEARAGADLAIVNDEALRYSGPINFSAPDLPAFAALIGAELADAPGFDSLALDGAIDGGASGISLADAALGFDDIEAEGAFSLDWSGAKPRIGGALSTDRLDLRPYMPPPTESAEGFPEWSQDEFDLGGLANIDGAIDLAAEEILLNDLRMGPARMKVTIDNARMTADIPELAMYGGQGSGRLVVNARERVPSFSGDFDLSAVKAEDFSVDMLRHDNILGLAGMKLNFSASGASQAAIMQSIDGSGGFDVADGALKGVNLAALARAAAALRAGGVNPAALTRAVAEARGPRQETEFTEFLTNFSMADGLVTAPTITMNGPFVAMRGEGRINLAEQTIDLRLAPRATTSIDGETGRAIAVPVRVGGTFSKPSIALDAEALARAGLENALSGFLGAPASDSSEGTARRVLEGVLGRERPGDGDAAAETAPAGDDGEGETQSPADDPIAEGLRAIFGGARNSDDGDDAENNGEDGQ